jgi:hypothetical protein
MSRLAEATQRGRSVSLEDIELQQPFIQRVVVPLIEKFGEISTRFTPQETLQDYSQIGIGWKPWTYRRRDFLATALLARQFWRGL